jgi:riboflavin synthase
MFTGLITDIGTVTRVVPRGEGADMRLVIATSWPIAGIALGASIACGGCCLTVVETGDDRLSFDASGETLAKTTLGLWKPGTRVNLERSLKLGDELGGHLVSGHVDGTGRLVSRVPEAGSLRLSFALPVALGRYVAVKGSIAVDGVSLTVNEVADRRAAGESVFAVNVIPHTQQLTTLGALAPGDAVNVEVDMLARYVARLNETV